MLDAIGCVEEALVNVVVAVSVSVRQLEACPSVTVALLVFVGWIAVVDQVVVRASNVLVPAARRRCLESCISRSTCPKSGYGSMLLVTGTFDSTYRFVLFSSVVKTSRPFPSLFWSPPFSSSSCSCSSQDPVDCDNLALFNTKLAVLAHLFRDGLAASRRLCPIYI